MSISYFRLFWAFYFFQDFFFLSKFGYLGTTTSRPTKGKQLDFQIAGLISNYLLEIQLPVGNPPTR